MKKKLLVGMLTLAIVFSLAGCGGESEKQISGDVKTNEQGSTQEVKTNDEKKEQVQDEEAANGYVFTVNGINISIGEEAEPVLEKVGEPLSKYESPSCAFGDLDVSYTYGGYEIDTYQEKSVDYISAVILLDDSVSTPEGLYIGDDQEKVKEFYGEPTSVNGENMIYNNGDMKLVVIMKDSKVSSIQYLNTLLD